ncbi:hypothetical protein WMY93_011634 [Mugilogobius chulae]|uniref:Alpha 1,3-galactosyltransferase 2 n=1 Tax=Mugilogobius chulae TaxID=88201 RepID=A0AAW0P996_9GOBI
MHARSHYLDPEFYSTAGLASPSCVFDEKSTMSVLHAVTLVLMAKMSHKMKNVLRCLFLIPFVLCVLYFTMPSLRVVIGLIPMDKCTLESGKMLLADHSVDSTLDLQRKESLKLHNKYYSTLNLLSSSCLCPTVTLYSCALVLLCVLAICDFLQVVDPSVFVSGYLYFRLALRVRGLLEICRLSSIPRTDRKLQKYLAADLYRFGRAASLIHVHSHVYTVLPGLQLICQSQYVRNVRSRGDVQTCTKWNAPIIWEGMFDSRLYDESHRRKKSSVALTVFAVGKYLDAYLKTFLNSSEQHFMLGLRVTYYVFTDMPEKVPAIPLAPNRHLKVIQVDRHSRWQDISMMRMKTISDVIESEIRHNFTHVFCFDVDQKFTGRFGSEALGNSVALLHAYYYRLPKTMYTYDHNPKSKAFMETGDFYYHAAVFGGRWKNVKAITDACYQSIMEDKENNVEALWHDESHLNKYFWQHKPSRLLSPEYCWDEDIGYRTDIRVKRLLWAPKDYKNLRLNE